MELALLPIAALLLLISGAGGPAPVGFQRQTTDALIQLFGAEGPIANDAVQSCAGLRRQGVRQSAGRYTSASLLSSVVLVSAGLQGRLAAPGLRPFSRKQYRTRFGFPEGAYLAAGPPTPLFRTGLVWA